MELQIHSKVRSQALAEVVVAQLAAVAQARLGVRTTEVMASMAPKGLAGLVWTEAREVVAPVDTLEFVAYVPTR
jgi:LDH2 family malate/lactate/ureidoglycolate dehydrogenase